MRYDGKNRNKCSKSNIILCTLIAVIFCLAVVPITAKAHSPGSVTLGYNLSSKTLIVTIVHNTSSPNSHYINKVTLTKNGKPAGSYTYQNQPDPSEFSYTYDLSARIGDTIEVTAYCSVSGTKTAKLIVKKLAT
jgi:hypothetical protein